MTDYGRAANYGTCPKCRRATLVLSDVYGAYCADPDCDYVDNALD